MRARSARMDSMLWPCTACGWRVSSHANSVRSAASMTGATGHNVSSKSKLMTRGAMLIHAEATIRSVDLPGGIGICAPITCMRLSPCSQPRPSLRARRLGPPPKPRRSLSACRTWFAWSASRNSPYPPTANGLPTRCARPTWMRTRGAPASGFSIRASATRRRCESATYRPTRMPPRGAAMGVSSTTSRIAAARRRCGAAAPGGEPLQVTNLPLDVGSFRVAPTADRLLVSLEVYRDCSDLACTKARLDAAAHSAARGVLYDRIFVRHWDAWSDGRRSQLFSIALDAGGPRQRNAGEFDRRDRRRRARQTVRRPRGLCDQPGREAKWRSRCARCRSASPGRLIIDIYTVPAARRSRAERDRRQSGLGRAAGLLARRLAARLPRHGPAGIRGRPLSSGAAQSEDGREERADARTGTARSRASPGRATARRLYATTDHLGQQPLWAIDATTGRASAITGDGEVEGFSVGPKKVLFTLSTLASSGGSLRGRVRRRHAQQLTHLNQALLDERALGEYEQFSFAGWNNENVFGYVIKPADFKRDQKYPVAFIVHGGPQGSMANQWHWRWNAQSFAGAGYGVVMIDFHGSTGLRPGVHRRDQRRLGRQAARGSQAGTWPRRSSNTPGWMATGCARSADPTAAT